MKREWFIYSPTGTGVWAEQMREALPPLLRTRLLNEPYLQDGICADAGDATLVTELDENLRIGLTTKAVRILKAEVDRRSINSYRYYIIGFPSIEPVVKSNSREIEAPTGRAFAQQVEFRWPLRIDLGLRELANWVKQQSRPFDKDGTSVFPSIMDRILLANRQTKERLEAAEVRGVEYVPVADGCWMVEVLRRRRCRADAVLIKEDDYDPLTQSIGSTAEFGLRYEEPDIGVEDLQIIDRIETDNEQYYYRRPLLIASARFVDLCIQWKINRIMSPHVLFTKGLVPLLVGRGRITTTLEKYQKTS